MFSGTSMRNFEMFSMTHMLTLALFLIIGFLFIFYREKISLYQSFIKWTLFSILLLSEISHQIWTLLNGIWTVSDLPLQLCSLSTFLALFLFLKPNIKVFNLLFFIGLLPAILSMVTPEMVYQFPHYRYIKYFLHHSSIPLAVLYFVLIEGYRVPRKAVLSSFLLLNIIAVPIFLINQLFETNFFYLAEPTDAKTILTLFGSGIKYYINLEIVGILVFIITYIPMGLLQRRENKERMTKAIVIDKEE